MRTAHAPQRASRSLSRLTGDRCCWRSVITQRAIFWLLFVGNAAEADDDNDGPARFHAVNGWRGTIVASAKANPDTVSQHDRTWREGGKGAEWAFDFNAFFSAEFVLEDYESDPSVWRGRVSSSEYSAGYRYFLHVPDSYKNGQTW